MKYPKGIIKETDSSKDSVEFNEDQLINIREGNADIEIRKTHDFKGKAFFLHSLYDWVIVLDSGENLCLVPIKKTED